MSPDKFLYFSYGSNLSLERIRINNKSANFYCVGLLKGFAFTFQGYSKFWKGATANIVKDDQSQVYGIIWEIDQSDLSNLDRQEVHYDRIEVNVQDVKTGESYKCWTYTQTADFEKEVGTSDKPSLKYKLLVISGAKLNEFPEYYLKMLSDFEDNGITDCGPKLQQLENKCTGAGDTQVAKND